MSLGRHGSQNNPQVDMHAFQGSLHTRASLAEANQPVVTDAFEVRSGKGLRVVEINGDKVEQAGRITKEEIGGTIAIKPYVTSDGGDYYQLSFPDEPDRPSVMVKAMGLKLNDDNVQDQVRWRSNTISDLSGVPAADAAREHQHKLFKSEGVGSLAELGQKAEAMGMPVNVEIAAAPTPTPNQPKVEPAAVAPSPGSLPRAKPTPPSNPEALPNHMWKNPDTGAVHSTSQGDENVPSALVEDGLGKKATPEPEPEPEPLIDALPKEKPANPKANEGADKHFEGELDPNTPGVGVVSSVVRRKPESSQAIQDMITAFKDPESEFYIKPGMQPDFQQIIAALSHFVPGLGEAMAPMLKMLGPEGPFQSAGVVPGMNNTGAASAAVAKDEPAPPPAAETGPPGATQTADAKQTAPLEQPTTPDPFATVPV